MDAYRRLAVVAVASLVTVLLAGSPVAAQNELPKCNGKTVTIWGDEGHNRIFGTPGPDVIHGLGGRDRIRGGGGGDTICGGEGADVLFGQRGRDWIDGGNGRDRIVGGVGQDTIIAGRGNDTVNGGFGNDTISAGPGFDFIFGAAGVDDCDLDWRDAFFTCETGDVVGVTGGTGPTAVSVPDSFVLNTYPAPQGGGQGLQAAGEVNVWVVQLAVFQSTPAPARIIVRDSQGTVLLDRELAVTAWQEQIFIFGADIADVEVVDLASGGAFDVAFTHTSLTPKFNGDGVTGGGSLPFVLRNPIGPNDTVQLIVTPNPGASVSTLVTTMAPGEGPVVSGEATGITQPTTIPLQLPPGTTMFSVQAGNATWQVVVTRG